MEKIFSREKHLLFFANKLSNFLRDNSIDDSYCVVMQRATLATDAYVDYLTAGHDADSAVENALALLFHGYKTSESTYFGD